MKKMIILAVAIVLSGCSGKTEMKPGEIVVWEVTAPGQSGFIRQDGEVSEHYDDQFEMYYTYGRKRTWFYPEDVESNKQSEVTLNY